MRTQKPPRIPLPKGWPSHVKSGVLHIISLATLPAPNRRPKIAGPLHLFAVASLAVFLAHPLRETLESEFGVLDFGLSLPPSLLGAGLDLFFQHLRGLGAGLRVMAEFLGGANHESAKKTHLWMYSV